LTRNPSCFVLDTNVLLYDPKALEVFDEHEVVIPMTVLEEIDKFKRDMNETGRNAREASRRLDALREHGSLREGIQLASGGRIRVGFPGDHDEVENHWGADNNDNRILQLVLSLHRRDTGRVVLVTRDVNMRLKCDALGVPAEDYEHSRLDVGNQYTGIAERIVDDDLIADLYASVSVRTDAAADLYPHQFVVLRSGADEGRTSMARVLPDRGGFKLVGRHKDGAWGVLARNKEQLFAMELLLDPEVQLVTLHGVAGTGKTLLAIACALKQTADQRLYRRVLVSRPIFPLGRDVGFLPGDLNEKLNPWMQPIFDNLDFLLSSRPTERRRGQEPEYQYLLDAKIVEVEALTYIRGRSIPQQFLIVDEAQNLTPHEAQNLTPHEVKTVLTRAGEGTKIVLTGDPQQIDNPYVDEVSNGLTYAVERFKDAAIAGHVTLRKGERSPLAELAARAL
jgi:PhoH-like ATPase